MWIISLARISHVTVKLMVMVTGVFRAIESKDTVPLANELHFGSLSRASKARTSQQTKPRPIAGTI